MGTPAGTELMAAGLWACTWPSRSSPGWPSGMPSSFCIHGFGMVPGLHVELRRLDRLQGIPLVAQVPELRRPHAGERPPVEDVDELLQRRLDILGVVLDPLVVRHPPLLGLTAADP